MLNLDALKKNFVNIDFREKRSNIYKVLLPFFHEDGDMYDVFIEEREDRIRISDYGLTLMKLSYTFDLDTENKNDIFQSVISQNRCETTDGEIYLDVSPQQFVGGIYQFIQTITKVSTLDILSKEVIKSLFYEHLNRFVTDNFTRYNIERNFLPTKDEDLVVDYVIQGTKPLYLFGVNEDTKAAKVVINCLSFHKNRVPFRSVIVHEDFNSLTRYNRNQLTNAADKQFTTLDEFRNAGIDYFDREIAS